MTFEDTFIATNGIRLHAVVAGPANGPLAILLHGFPEFWYGWRKQIAPLAEAGYRVLVPDQRGYNVSDKPPGVRSYRIDELARDVVGLIDAMGRDRAILVGHDFGAAVAWWLGLRHSDRVEKLVVINVPHPAVMQRHLRRSPRQMRKSWYMLFFQIPLLPEALIRGGGRMAFGALRRTGRPDAFADEDEDRYLDAWRQPGALRAMIDWYRALLRGPRSIGSPRVAVPTLIVWGARDRFLERSMARASASLCDRARLVILEDATHWVQHEERARLNELLLGFFAER